ncbi:MAG: hypothetical protein IJT21_05100 [Synergistaceae bacterium]|nr:hypothetical protein [Synergistaceae bacterium]
MKRNFTVCLLILLFAAPVLALDSNALPDKATLSANRMRFDAYTGDFLADGNVTINAGDFNVKAPTATGNTGRKEVNFDKGITAAGRWNAAKIDLNAGKLLLTFAEIPTCKFLNGVKGGYGSMHIDADRLTLTGLGGISDPTATDRQTKFWLTKVRNLEDRSKGFSFGAETVEGIIRNGDLFEMTAKKGVWIRGKPKARGDAVNLKGDSAVYSLTRGSVVVSGHVVAVQGGRTLKSDSIVYFPDQNRVEALGGITRQRDGGVSTDRAEITIDLTRERRNNPPAPKPDNNKPQPQRRTRRK